MVESGKTIVSVVSLNDSNYGMWKIQCRMALMKEGLWGIVSGTEVAPAQSEADKFTKFVTRRDKALAIIVLFIDPSLLYLLGDPEDPKVVWKKLADQFQKKTWANKLALRRRLNNLKLRGDSVQKHVKESTEIFNDSSVISAAMDEEYKVVTLLARLPDSFDMLVTALEANATIPRMETVTERLLHEERKLNERETSVTSSEKVLLGKKAKSKGPRCFSCNKFGHTVVIHYPFLTLVLLAICATTKTCWMTL